MNDEATCKNNLKCLWSGCCLSVEALSAVQLIVSKAPFKKCEDFRRSSALCTLNRRGGVANNETHHNRQQQTKALNNYYDTSLNVLKLLLDNVNTFPSSAFDMTGKTRDADESFRILTAWATGRQNERRCCFCLRITYTAERDNSHRLKTFSCGKNRVLSLL